MGASWAWGLQTTQSNQYFFDSEYMNSSMSRPSIVWYIYFSWWLFAWFVLFKLGFIQYNPFLFYVIAVSYITIRYLIQGVLSLMGKNVYPNVRTDSLLTIGAVAMFVDVLPILYLQPHVSIQSTLFGVLVMFVYLLTMSFFGHPVVQQYTPNYFRRALRGKDTSPRRVLSMIFMND